MEVSLACFHLPRRLDTFLSAFRVLSDSEYLINRKILLVTELECTCTAFIGNQVSSWVTLGRLPTLGSSSTPRVVCLHASCQLMWHDRYVQDAK